MNQSKGNVGKPTHRSRMTDRSEYYKLATLWDNVPNSPKSTLDAAIAWPGIELKSATRTAVYLYNRGFAKELLVAGYHEEEIATSIFSEKNFRSNFDLKRLDKVHTQEHASHAGIQAKWTAEKIKELNIKSAFLCVPSFHSLRAVLGILESCRKIERLFDIVLMPFCPTVSPFKRDLLDIGTCQRVFNQMDVIDGEIDGGVQERIPAYQREKQPGVPGDNLTTELFIKWLEWLYQQPLIESQLLK